jgi:hypothetical protein
MNKQTISRKITVVLVACLGMLYLCLGQPAYPQTSSKLELKEIIKATAISPQDGLRYGRPEVIVINNRIFAAFNNIKSRVFQLVELNEDLSHRGPIVNLFSDSAGPNFPTDIRLASDGRNLWYAFETVLGHKISCDNHFLNIAKYRILGTRSQLEAQQVDIARGCPSAKGYMHPPDEIPEDPEITDDPTPFFYNGKYVVLTRAWKGGLQHIRIFDKDLRLAEHFTLDLSPILEGRLLSQNALAEIEGQIYLLGALFDGPPINPNSNSAIYAIPLTNDLRAVAGKIIPLFKHPGEYFSKVTAARYDKGKLYINYVRAESGKQFQHLAVFDVENDFALITKTQFQDKSVPINHASMDILGKKVYVVYQEKPNEIVGKVFEWKKTEKSTR